MRFPVLIFLLVAYACGPASKKGVSKKMEHPSIYQAGGIFMQMSGVFLPSRFPDIIDLWINSGKPHEMIEKRIEDLRMQQELEGPSFIFRDTTDIRNTLFFTEVPYLDVEEGTEEKMFSDFQSVMIENSKKIGVTCQPVVNDFFSLSNGDRVYKMSYLISYSSVPEYSTTYFIATKTRIVMVIVHNVADDGEATVRSMNIDRYFYVDPLPGD